DMIVLNSLQDAGAGFGCDTNKVTIYRSNGEQTAYPLESKSTVAKHIINAALPLLNAAILR
ncbi:MAG: phosphopantothenoylcysteine decarboxylase, partial [Paludibacteraceae bacterium]|nr:phosphopantothenoylcysteine decarboxylase [Paludibacteraceae bacterium]